MKARESDVQVALANIRDVIEEYLKKHMYLDLTRSAQDLCDTIADFIPVDADDVGVTVLNDLRDHITVDLKIPSHVFAGWTAGELRAIGAPVPESVPDCAVLTRDPESHVGAMRYAWTELHFELKGESDGG